MRKADYALLAQILKYYSTLAKQNSDDKVMHYIDAISVDFMRGASVNKVEFYKACMPK